MLVDRIVVWLSVGWLAALITSSILVGWFGPDPLSVNLSARLRPPDSTYLLGADELGRSVLSRLLYAARSTIVITSVAAIFSLALGALFGLLAGWYGGWVDLIVSGIIALFWSVPFAVFAVLVLAIVGSTVGSVILVIVGVNWVSSARVVRAEMLRLRHSPFVRSAKCFGFSNWHILVRQIFPNLGSTVIVLASFGAAEALALESGLAYLGMSLPPPLPTWGGTMSDGLAYLSTAWWISLLPAIAITMTLASLRSLITFTVSESERR